MAIRAIDVTDPAFMADPTGATDSTSAIQAAFDCATGTADPATNSRVAAAPVYIPPGYYKITRDLLARSVVGFRLMCANAGQTVLIASGNGFTQAPLVIDGSLDAIVEGLAIQGDGTEMAGSSILPNGIRLDGTSAAARTTSGNLFRDIRIRALKASKLFSCEGTGTRQLDGTTMHNVVVTGTQTAGAWSASGPSQVGFAFGNGSWGNNYNHVQTACSAAACNVGWNVNVSSLALTGAQPASNGTDFVITPSAQTTISNVQSQNCGTFLSGAAAFSPSLASFSGVSIVTFVPSLSNNLMISINGSIWEFNNISMTNILRGSSWVGGTISVNGTTPSRPCIASFKNLAVNNSKLTAFASLSNARVNVSNFANYNVATGVYAAPVSGDQVSAYNGSWSNVVL
jgi:hypothetical protein